MHKSQDFLQKYELPLFLLLTYALSWWSVPFANGQLIPHGPALAALIVLGITAGRQGLGEWWRRVTRWRIPFIWFIAGPAVILGYHAIGLVVNVLMGAQVVGMPHISLPIFLELLFLGGLWEEPGWSGYLLPKMRDRFASLPKGLLVAALVTGLFRSIWHLPLFLYGHIPWFDIFLFTFAFQLLIAWVFYRNGGSVLAVMVLHFVSNLMYSFTYPIFTGADRKTYMALFMSAAILFALTLVLKSQFKKDTRMKTTTATHKLLDFLKRALVRVTIFVLVLAIVGMIYQTAGAEADRKNHPAPGDLIDVGCFKMHIHCMGEGSPTVILETLAGGTSSYWGWVQPDVAAGTQVCVYDRAGRGWSDADPEPVSLERTARNLHTLLTNARIEGPYVMVGHSLGGIYVRQFAANYPDEVVGVVLIDAAHPEQFDRYPQIASDNDVFIQITKLYPAMARIGINRLYFATGGEFDFGDLIEPQKSELKALWSSPDYFLSQQAEMNTRAGLYEDGKKLGTLGNLPLIVISAGQNTPVGWADLQKDLALLSSNSLHITIEEASHVSLAFHQNDAHQVSLAILQLVHTVQTGTRMDL